MASRSLPMCPPSVEGADGAPRFGTYEGVLPRVSLAALRGLHQPHSLRRLVTHKKWLYAFVATREVAALFAVVDVNYTSNAFVMAVDLAKKEVLVDESYLGPPRPLVKVNDQPGSGLEVGFRRPEASFSARRPEGDQRYHLGVTVGWPVPFRARAFSLDAHVLAAGAAPALTVIAPVDEGGVNVTQKWAGLLTLGSLEAKGRTYVLDGGVGGLDYTHGYLARRTAWRWGFACGRLADGTPLGVNLVEGFNESRDDVNENAVWLGNTLFPVGRARFTFNAHEVLDPWRVTTDDGAVDLVMTPIAAHREHRDLKLVVSHFAQPVGLWRGTVTVGGVRHEVHDVPGVTEDQSVLW